MDKKENKTNKLTGCLKKSERKQEGKTGDSLNSSYTPKSDFTELKPPKGGISLKSPPSSNIEKKED